MATVLDFIMGFGSGGHIFVKEVCFVSRPYFVGDRTARFIGV